MRMPTLRQIRHETRFVMRISDRDLPTRVATGLMMLSVCWWAGAQTIAIALALILAFFELAAKVVTRWMPQRDADISIAAVFGIWLLNITSAVFYLLPGLVLANQTSVAFLMAGYLWLFGVYVYISNSFAALPFYNWSQMTPAFGAAFVMFYLASQTVHSASTPQEWLVTYGLMLVYMFNTTQTMSAQKDTQRELDRAREAAHERLQALEHLARHDSLTGLANRHAFDEELARLLASPQKTAKTALLLIDLDGFKPINDTYSHDAGDTVLIEVGRRLAKSVDKDRAIVARLGGDEFGVALPGMSSGKAALRFAQHLATVIARPIQYEGKDLRVSCSIGIDLASDRNVTVAELCAHADQAMYRAKADPGRTVSLYSASSFPRRTSLEDRAMLLTAITTGRIRPYYQPKVCLDGLRTYGFEALARWPQPDGTLRPPGSFIPQIDELGLQGDFMMHMARQVLGDMQSLVDDGLNPGQVSVNLPEMALATHSGRADLLRLLADHPGLARHITFEITEDVFINRAADIIQASIARFRAAGVRVSLDDFGTGFASFQHLRQLEFDELKIDTSFVADLGVDPAAEVLIAGFLSIGAGLGVQVIAEGIETPDQLRHLRKLGCKVAQGYLFGKAMPLDETRIRLFAEQAGDSTGPIRRAAI